MKSDDLVTGLEAAVRLAIAQYLMAYGPDMKPSEAAEIVGSRLAAAAIERLVAERDEALKQAEWWKKCDWWEGGQHDYHRSRATRLEAGLLKLRPGNGTDTERLAAIEQETGLSFTPKLTTHLEPHPAEAQRDKLKEALQAMVQRFELYLGPDNIHAGHHDLALVELGRQALKDAP